MVKKILDESVKLGNDKQDVATLIAHWVYPNSDRFDCDLDRLDTIEDFMNITFKPACTAGRFRFRQLLCDTFTLEELIKIRDKFVKVLSHTECIKDKSVNEAKTNNPKFISVYVSQEYVPGYGWEDIVQYDDTSSQSLRDAEQNVKDYKDNGYNARVITRLIDNPNYIEPANNITFEQAVGWVKNCPYNVEELYIQYPNKNYLLKNDDTKWNPAQVFVYSDDTVRVRNCKANRTKQVYSIAELEKEVNRILGL